MHTLTYKKVVYENNKIYFNSVLKVFNPSLNLANNSQEKFIILNVSRIGFLCYLDSEENMLWGTVAG